ncbi:MAG: response regulator transcription factor [Chloroflexi bacterium]|nr:response regulator transcription factor [Chloroflexota bacterium]
MESSHHRIRVLLVDNHPMVRRALRDLLECYSDIEVIGTAEDGPGALDAVRNFSPDVILLDVALPGLSGIQVARQVRRAWPALRIIMLTSYDPQYVEQVTGGCAHAYLSNSRAEKSICEAIRGVYHDQSS